MSMPERRLVRAAQINQAADGENVRHTEAVAATRIKVAANEAINGGPAGRESPASHKHPLDI